MYTETGYQNSDDTVEISSGQFCHLDWETIDGALGSAGRVYLVGHLLKEQAALEHIGSLKSPLEVGITRYNCVTVEEPHLHEWNTELIMVQSGQFAVMNLSSGDWAQLGAGGLFAIDPGVPHALVASTDAQILFIKAPGGNDKVVLELRDDAREWIDRMSDTFSA